MTAWTLYNSKSKEKKTKQKHKVKHLHHRKCNIVQYTTCLAWKERRRGYRGGQRGGARGLLFFFFYLQKPFTNEGGFTLHQRSKQDKEKNFFFPGGRLTSTAQHHKTRRLHIGSRKKRKKRNHITTSQSERSPPVNSETLKRQHMAATQHYSVHGPIKHVVTNQRSNSFGQDTILKYTRPLFILRVFAKFFFFRKQRPFSTLKT